MNRADPRQMIARLAVAVMIADGHVTADECDAVERLDAIGLGPISPIAEDELRRAAHAPIDIEATCGALGSLSAQAAAVLVSVLVQIAASDGSAAPRELATIDAVAGYLGLSSEEAAHIVESTIAGRGVRLERRGPADGGAPTAAAASARPKKPDESPPPDAPDAVMEAAWAYRTLGVSADADLRQLQAAYLTAVERFNPAKVTALGTEFVVLAARKLAEVTMAYETLSEQMAPSP